MSPRASCEDAPVADAVVLLARRPIRAWPWDVGANERSRARRGGRAWCRSGCRACTRRRGGAPIARGFEMAFTCSYAVTGKRREGAIRVVAHDGSQSGRRPRRTRARGLRLVVRLREGACVFFARLRARGAPSLGLASPIAPAPASLLALDATPPSSASRRGGAQIREATTDSSRRPRPTAVARVACTMRCTTRAASPQRRRIPHPAPLIRDSPHCPGPPARAAQSLTSLTCLASYATACTASSGSLHARRSYANANGSALWCSHRRRSHPRLACKKDDATLQRRRRRRTPAASA